MFRSIIILTFRNIARNRICSIINLTGLVIGLTCSLMIFIWVWNHLTYERFHQNLEHIFIMQQTMKMGNGEYTTDRCGGSCVPALVEGFPEIKRGVRTCNPGELLFNWTPGLSGIDSSNVTSEEKKFIENEVLAVDTGFLTLFTFPLIRGNPETALSEPYSIVISEKMAEKYFGTNEPLGQLIRINQTWLFTVTGVAENVPENTNLQFEFLVPFGFLAELGYNLKEFGGNPFNNYLFLDDPKNYKQVKNQLPDFFKASYDTDIEVTYNILPFSRMHMFGENKSIYAVITFSILSFLILLIACINFMNLSTARYIGRTIEVGIRKVAGATRWQLIRQFMGETLILVFIAINLSVFMIDLMIPEFNKHFLSKIQLNLADPVFISSLIGILFITGIIAGSYPALFLSSFKPVQVLKKEFLSVKRGLGLRKALVIVQFIFSFIFLVVTTFTFRQYDHLRTGNFGVSRENIIYFPVRGELTGHISEVKAGLLKNPDIKYVTTASRVPLFIDRGEFEWGSEPDVTNDLARVIEVGYDFDKTFNISLVDGRFYSPEYSMDSINSMVINEAVARTLGYDAPIGKDIYLFNEKYTIIGVMGDFVSFPVKLGGEKLLLQYSSDPHGNLMFIKTTSGNRQDIIKYIENVHDQFNPDYPFIYLQLEDYTDPITEFMRPTARIILYFTLFGILISCLGLFGLAVFTAEQRIKEIGIRKAMGSSGKKIMLLFSLDFLRLIVISLLISIPVSYLLVRIMLRQFAERVYLDPLIFIGAALLIFGISFITISYQSIKSANMNPAETLRYE